MERILIARANPTQLESALVFVQGIYRSKFGTVPSSIWPECLVAVDIEREQVIGVVAMEFSDGNEFEIERLFDFDFEEVLNSRASIVSFGRWVTESVGLGAILAFAATSYAIDKGRKESLSCAKPELLEFLRRKYGLRFDTFATKIKLENIRAEDRAFFEQPPRPRIYSGNLSSWRDRLRKSIRPGVRIEL